jgi:hypothetical protein
VPAQACHDRPGVAPTIPIVVERNILYDWALRGSPMLQVPVIALQQQPQPRLPLTPNNTIWAVVIGVLILLLSTTADGGNRWSPVAAGSAAHD